MKPVYRVPSRVTDSYQNLNARLGVGAGSMADAGRYAFNPITRQNITLDAMYRGSWIVGAAVDCVADDMVAKGIDFKGVIEPDRVEKLKNALGKMVWGPIANTVRWSRLYGGSLAVMLIDGQDPAEPLRVQAVTKGQFRGLAVLDRWMVQPSVSELVSEASPAYGMPIFYTVNPTQTPLSGKKVHHTRALRMEGVPLPFYQRYAEMGWGMSVVERLFDRLLAFDQATNGASQLVLKAYLRTIKVEGLRQILAAGGEAYEALVKQMLNIRLFQSSEGLTLIDAKDDFQTHTYQFSGLDEVLLQFGQQLSGALQIPMVRLYGQSPAGLNSSGESDLRTYYDGIRRQQEATLREPLERILTVLNRSLFGVDDEIGFTFNSLLEMSEEQKANIAERVTTSVVNAFNAGIVDRKTALSELRQSSDVTGVWSNITDEQIKEAEDDEPPVPDLSEGRQEAEQSGAAPGLEGGEVLRNESEEDRPPRR